MPKEVGRLVLSRKENEKILISTKTEQILVTVLKAKEPIKLVIESPKHIGVDRYEVAIAKGLV